MSGNYPAGVTDSHPHFDMPDAPQADDRADAEEALWRAGMEPMDSAPTDREIDVIVEESLQRVTVKFDDMALWYRGDRQWFDVQGDGAPDGKCPRWDDDELLGWFEVAP